MKYTKKIFYNIKISNFYILINNFLVYFILKIFILKISIFIYQNYKISTKSLFQNNRYLLYKRKII